MKYRWKIAQWFELQWWQRYLAHRDKNQYLHWKRDYWMQFLSNMKEFYQPKSSDVLLDLGCGPAGIFIAFPQNEIDAIDPLLNAYEDKLSTFSKKEYQQVHFIQENIEEFTSTKVYDTIFCINVINHVEDIHKAIQNIYQLASNHSKIIISIDCHNYIALQKLFALIPGDILHPHQYTLSGYKKLFEQYGFKISFEKKLKSATIFDYWVIGMQKE